MRPGRSTSPETPAGWVTLGCGRSWNACVQAGRLTSMVRKPPVLAPEKSRQGRLAARVEGRWPGVGCLLCTPVAWGVRASRALRVSLEGWIAARLAFVCEFGRSTLLRNSGWRVDAACGPVLECLCPGRSTDVDGTNTAGSCAGEVALGTPCRLRRRHGHRRTSRSCRCLVRGDRVNSVPGR